MADVIEPAILRAEDFGLHMFTLLYPIVNAKRAPFVKIIDCLVADFPCRVTAGPLNHGRIHVHHTKLRGTNIDGVNHGLHHGPVFLFTVTQCPLRRLCLSYNKKSNKY